MTIQLLYILATLISISATVPQIRRVMRVRSARELNLGTYATWMLTSSVTLLYVIHLGDQLLIATSVAWVVYYVIMTGAIFYFRRNPAPVLQEVPIMTEVEAHVCEPQYNHI